MNNNFEDKFNELINNKDIVFYDYNFYQRYDEYMSLSSYNNKTIYRDDLFNMISDYYAFGLNIKELIKFKFSNGKCHLCSLLLSLCFDNVKIITCNLKDYVTFYNKNNKSNKCSEFIHSFLLVNINNIDYVIDTTFCFILEYSKYINLFNIEIINEYTNDDIKNNQIYNYLNNNKNNNNIFDDNNLNIFKNMCINYKSNKEKMNKLFNNYIPNAFPYLKHNDLIKYNEYIIRYNEMLNNDPLYSIYKSK